MRTTTQLGIALALVAAIASAAWSQTASLPIIIANPVAAPTPSNANGAPFYPAQIQQAYGINTLQSGGGTGSWANHRDHRRQ